MEFSTTKPAVLVLGGSNFVGKTFLQELSMLQNYQAVYVNRGKNHWNNEIKQIPNLYYQYGDRNDKKDFTLLLNYLNNKFLISEERRWEMVVDFCGFKKTEVYSVFQSLKDKVKLYIFISTDSLYDTCDPKLRQSVFVKEEDAKRPTDKKLQKKLNESEEYGHRKLECEELLYQIQRKYPSSFPFICLRQPDVIGPYDDSSRYWCYLKWILELPDTYPLEVDESEKDLKLSLVFSQDIAKQLLKFLQKVGEDQLGDLLYQSFNIACQENPTLEDFLKMIQEDLKTNKVVIKKLVGTTFYPSVECGPIDISKARSIIGWQSTPLHEIVKTTNQFFLDSRGKYLEEEEEANKKLRKKLKI